jgi:hypothetical protein
VGTMSRRLTMRPAPMHNRLGGRGVPSAMTRKAGSDAGLRRGGLFRGSAAALTTYCRGRLSVDLVSTASPCWDGAAQTVSGEAVARGSWPTRNDHLPAAVFLCFLNSHSSTRVLVIAANFASAGGSQGDGTHSSQPSH